MQSLKEYLKEKQGSKHVKSIGFPDGLPGFEHLHEFILIANEEDMPFIWLQAVEDTSLAFLTIDPFLVCAGYLPDIPDADLESLKMTSPEDLFMCCIVNMRNNQEQGITVNLISPLLINWKQQVGKQVILQNFQDYSVRHRIDPLSP